ncbi:MAG TPA: helix-turn-helix domain-containing protein [Ktedonobacteraceae bacterium]|nr:helix-turn-helix domain-containing protein [Ktedonobacteraceae bacterium]
MEIDEKERERIILDAATEVILRHGYNKTTMSDVADAAGLHRGLIYLHFKSKDDLLEALIIRELNTYGETWSSYLQADPLGGTVASVYRSMLHAIKPLPLMAAILTRDEQTFGKYLRKPDNLFTYLSTGALTRDFLRIMQEAGAVRQDADVVAMAFIMDELTPSILRMLASQKARAGREPEHSNRLSYDSLMETISEMLERMLTPVTGGHFEAGKAILLQGLADAREHFSQMQRQRKGNAL